MGNDDMLIVEFYAKLCVGKVFQHRPFHLYMFLFSHGSKATPNQIWNQPIISKSMQPIYKSVGHFPLIEMGVSLMTLPERVGWVEEEAIFVVYLAAT
jgi:hypothetical protein